jgi:hypothetical protein
MPTYFFLQGQIFLFESGKKKILKMGPQFVKHILLIVE